MQKIALMSRPKTAPAGKRPNGTGSIPPTSCSYQTLPVFALKIPDEASSLSKTAVMGNFAKPLMCWESCDRICSNRLNVAPSNDPGGPGVSESVEPDIQLAPAQAEA